MMPRARDWILTVIILLVVIFGFGYMAETDARQREFAAYALGFNDGKASVVFDLKANKDKIALEWWSGSQNIIDARKRMCNGVSQKAFEVKK